MAKRTRSLVTAAQAEVDAILSDATKKRAKGALLGDLSWWSFKPGWKGDANAVQAEAKAAGLNPAADLIPSPDWKLAFSRGVESQRAALRAADIRPEACSVGKDGATRIALMRVDRREHSANGGTIGVVALPKGGAPVVERADKFGHARRIVEVASAFRGRYVLDDIRAATVGVLSRWHSIPCREEPPHVVYWIPAGAGEHIRRVRNWLRAIGAGTLHFVPMHDDEDSKEAAGSAANAGIEAQLEAFATEVAAWEAALPARASTVEARIAELDNFRTTGGLYRAILGSSIRDCEKQLRAIDRGYDRILGLVSAKAEDDAA
jgi:hypothetical protein